MHAPEAHLFLVLLIYVCAAVCHSAPVNETPARRAVAFYHVFVSDAKLTQDIVADQLSTLTASGVYDVLESIYVTPRGGMSATDGFPDSELVRGKFHFLPHATEGNEIDSLVHIHNFCKAPDEINTAILYFHTKGSYHNSNGHTWWRKSMDCFVLTPRCLEIMETYDTCGLRMTPFPEPHYSGNFFWTRCGYVRKLVDPALYRDNATFRESFESVVKGPDWCVGSGRYWAEHWVGSHPDILPADCLPPSVSLWQTDEIHGPDFSQLCPNMRSVGERNSSTYGAPCSFISTFSSPLGTFAGTAHGSKNLECGSMQTAAARSQFYYGKYPFFLAAWRARYET